MPKRVRLTERRNREAVDGSIPYPGNVNQPDRQFKQHDQYDNWEEVVNHPLPDMRHDWKNDERDDIGYGVPEPWGQSPGAPTVASVRVAANKAVKLAYFLLGNKVAEEIIEDQANDFMLLGPEAIDRTLARFADTGELYAEDEGDDEDEDESEEGESKEAAEKKAEDEDAAEAEEGEHKDAAEAESAESEEGESKEAAEEKAEDEDESEEGESKEAAEKKAEDEDDDDDGDDEGEGDSKEASAEPAGMDIELGPAASGEEPEADERLASLFDDDIPEELPEPGAGQREASEKKGVKTLGGQPRVAGNGGESQDISSIWDDAPDVSEVFR